MTFGLTVGLVLILFSLKLLMIAAFINHRDHPELAAGAFVGGIVLVLIGFGILAGHLTPVRQGAMVLAGCSALGLSAGTTFARHSREPDNPAPANRLAIYLASGALFFLTLTVTLYLRS